MARDVTDLFDEAIAAASDAILYATDLDKAAFKRMPGDDGMRYRAMKNALTELGEALKGLPEETQRDIAERHPDVDWRGMVGLRDVVAHQYHRIDMDLLWPVITIEMPALVEALEEERAAISLPGNSPR